MSELDNFKKFMKGLDDYNRVQLRQTLEFSQELSKAVGTKDDPKAIIDMLQESMSKMKDLV